MAVAASAELVDPVCSRLLAAFQAELGAVVLGAEIQRREIIVRVELSAWVDAARACRHKLGFDYFSFLSGLDWLDNPLQTTRYENVWGSVAEDDEGGEDGEAATVEDAGPEPAPEPEPEPEAAVVGFRTGVAGGDTRFQVFARFVSTTEHRAITIKADLDEVDPHVPTISGVYAGANWHERETWEMYGFLFDGHPHLVHIYLPGAFEGFPLRKDFPLLAREVKPWPGLTNVEPIAEPIAEAVAEPAAEPAEPAAGPVGQCGRAALGRRADRPRSVA